LRLHDRIARSPTLRVSAKAPDPGLAVVRYRLHAPGYDVSARRTMWIRRAAVDRLCLRPGDRVLDVACGTGLSLAALQAAVGPGGEVTGIELSPDMIGIARRRVAVAGWDNVTLLESSIEDASIPGPLDAVLFHFTHDVMRSPQALERVFAATRPGARIAFAGMKYAPWWIAPLNLLVRAKARPYMTTLDGLARPWDLALPYLGGFDWYPVMFGTGYVGWGRRNRDGDAA
jgi:demethylmenaquinone methyltransferase/2-methoxy-6-polyprenyl-1,4-benzoquinol methylase